MALAIIRSWSMLTAIVLLYQQRIHGEGRVHALGDEGHLCHLLQHHGIVHGFGSILAPSERPVVLHQHPRSVVRVHALEALHYHVARLPLILTSDFSLCHIEGAGDVMMEVVGMGSSYVGNVDASLCPSGGIGGVGVHHAAYLWEGTVEHHVCRGV